MFFRFAEKYEIGKGLRRLLIAPTSSSVTSHIHMELCTRDDRIRKNKFLTDQVPSILNPYKINSVSFFNRLQKKERPRTVKVRINLKKKNRATLTVDK